MTDYLIDGIRLVLTCGAMPEQYDAWCKGEQVGYLRLRHGRFTVECPDYGGTLVYQARPDGAGAFLPEERDDYLRAAVDAIHRHYFMLLKRKEE